MNNRPLVLYHGSGCVDGFTAAWAAWRKFGSAADYVPVQYGEEPPPVEGRSVYVLDFCYKRPVMEGVARAARSLVVLDHHKTAAKDLQGLARWVSDELKKPVHVAFDMEKSGAMLAWLHFHPNRLVPDLVRYVQDRDLWHFALPESREVNAAVASYPFDFGLWSGWCDDGGHATVWADGADRPVLDGLSKVKDLAGEGRSILRYQRQLVDRHVKSAVEVDVAGHKVLAVNATVLFSEIAARLAEGRPFGVCWFVREDGKYVYSLRSAEGGVDVSEVASGFGGGGHRHAAGFQAGGPPPITHDLPTQGQPGAHDAVVFEAAAPPLRCRYQIHEDKIILESSEFGREEYPLADPYEAVLAMKSEATMREFVKRLRAGR